MRCYFEALSCVFKFTQRRRRGGNSQTEGKSVCVCARLETPGYLAANMSQIEIWVGGVVCLG